MSEDPPGYQPFPAFSEWTHHQFGEASYGRFVDLLTRAKELASVDDLVAAVQTATRIAAVDTGAIEGLYDVDRGFTRTIATELTTWESVANTRGEHVVRAIEDAISAYDFVLDLATQRERITEAVIRELHTIICRSQDTYTVHTSGGQQKQTLPKGEYKSYPNSPTLSSGLMHHYAPVIDTAAEMHRLVEELRSPDFQQAHPVLQASYAHYAFVRVHPFADGNGRVSRALASVFLYRHPGVPLVIFADQKDSYFDALEAADRGQHGQFVAFISERVIDAIQLVRSFLGSGAAPALSATRRTFRDSQLGRRGMSHREIDALSSRLLGLLTEEIQKQGAHGALGEIRFSVTDTPGASDPPKGFRKSAEQYTIGVILTSGPPADIAVYLKFNTYPAGPDHAGSDLIAVEQRQLDNSLDVYLREISPTISRVLELRISTWVAGNLSRAASSLVEATALRLRDLGYIP